jgi:hypothetical protein
MKASAKLVRTHAQLLESLDVSIRQLSDPDTHQASAPEISRWSVKDHLEHLSIADHRTLTFVERVRDGYPELETGGGPSLLGRVVLLLGGFPRGKGRAPERTLPHGETAEDLVLRFQELRERLVALEDSLPRIGAAPYTSHHFAFGDLNAAQWLRFAVIHDHHHRKIIRDITRAAGS